MSSPAENPSRNGPFPPGWLHHGKRQTRYRMESAEPELYSKRVAPGSGLSICQNPKLQLRADTREASESSSKHISVFLHQLTEVRE